MNPRIPEITAELQRIQQLISNTNSSEELIKLLGSLKLQAAQLYLETDMEIIAQNRASIESPNEIPTNEPVTNFEPIKEEVSLEDEIQESDEDLHSSQEISLENIEDPTPHEAPKQETMFEDEQPSVVEEKDDIQEDSAPVASGEEFSQGVKDRAKEVLNMFSFSRRFEFGNFLFGGDMQLFSVFICEMLTAHPGEARDQVYQKWYDNRNWSRKEESADDLKRNLRKMI